MPERGMLSDGAEMPDGLIGLTVASAAPGPSWTDIVQAGAAVFAAVGVVGGLFFSGYQIRKGRQEQEKGVQLQTAQHAQSLMQLLIEITSVMVERPYLAPYIVSDKAAPKVRARRHDEVLAYARLFMSFGEAVGWQIRAHQMTDDAAFAWRTYFEDLHKTSSTVRRVVERDTSLLAQETLWLFGVGPVEVTPELSPALVHLIKVEQGEAEADG